jgi:hypothetical protein
MSTPYTRDEHRAADALQGMRAIAETAGILRQVAAHDGHLDAHRGHVAPSTGEMSSVLDQDGAGGQ